MEIQASRNAEVMLEQKKTRGCRNAEYSMLDVGSFGGIMIKLGSK
jgi:hypothetical protein